MPDELHTFFQEDLVFNGVNAITGEYGQPPLSSRALVRLIRGLPSPDDYRSFVEHQKRLAALAKISDRLTRISDARFEQQEADRAVHLKELRFKAHDQAKWPVKPGAGNLARVEDVGWAVIFPSDMPATLQEEIKEALQPLLALRRQQAGDLFRIYEGEQGYRSGERKDQYFQRLGIGPGLADPQEMPFYIMLVGTPNEIPYGFQYQLDVMRGVGRLDFGDDVEAYHEYARHVVAAETGLVTLPRRAAFFAPTNPGDRATQLSGRYLAQPLYENLTVPAPERELALAYDWELLPLFLGENGATHARLQRLLGGDLDQKPALLFTASHGVEFPANHPAQLRHQGALLCQDWPGPGQEVRREHYFTGEDVAEDADLSGMMVFIFACYGAGTPELDQFALQAFKVREKIAPHGFTAALPQALLKRGALAVLGHVERAWGYSFVSPIGRLENQAFVTAMRTLMNGEPVGVATDSSFNMRYAELSSDLSADLEELKWDSGYMSDYELAHRWTANNDARSYVVIGDPAVRSPFVRDGGPDEPSLEGSRAEERPDLGTVTAPDDQPEVESVEPEVDERLVVASQAAISESSTPRPAIQESAVQEPPPMPRPIYVPAELRAGEDGVAFGLGDQFDRLKESLRAFTDQLAVSLGKAAEDIVTLDVRTYSTPDLAGVAQSLDEREEVRATLRALTRVAFDGDLDIYMPEKSDSSIDQALWMVHRAMVEEAQDSRARFLATMAELATRLLDSLKIGP